MLAIIIFLVGVFGTDTILYTAQISYPEPDFYVSGDTVITIEIEQVFVNREIPNDVSNKCQCVTWLREEHGIPIRGDAELIQPNVDRPYVGGVILINYDGVAHAGLIRAIFPSGNIYFESANLKECEVTFTTIGVEDSRIRGYWFRNINL